MSDDLLHDQLRADGARWRATDRPARSIDDLWPPGRIKRIRLAAALSAAASVVVLVVGVLVWTTATGGHRSAPTAAAGRSTRSGSSASGDLCLGDQFAVTSVSTRPRPAPTDPVVVRINLRYTGAHPCHIRAWQVGPFVQLVDSAGRVMQQGYDTSLIGTTERRVEPGQRLVTGAAWFTTCNAHGRAQRMQLYLQGPQLPLGRPVSVPLTHVPRPRCQPGEVADGDPVIGLSVRPQ